MKLLLVFLFLAVVGTVQAKERVCPPMPLIDCLGGMHHVGCCSSSDCHGGNVCCIGRCSTHCRPPISGGPLPPSLGVDTEFHVSPEKCSELKESVKESYTDRSY
ncbi:U15-lycotoxin-Ls1d-like [Argiope bruennichi]|uniref:Uncharacterized protein n=1 Tax=Argiope bruennichi TaxID=94029 RepID=A0A8T0E2I9_ARGBR|nr:U15-lycotoxin-Ls1d-like [Argiope bruennichi]KAF8764387.1 hypothetical protein HNY73_022463 [Argiope bruennichi]